MPTKIELEKEIEHYQNEISLLRKENEIMKESLGDNKNDLTEKYTKVFNMIFDELYKEQENNKYISGVMLRIENKLRLL